MIGDDLWFGCHDGDAAGTQFLDTGDTDQRDRPLAGCWKLSGVPDHFPLGKTGKHNDARLRLLAEALVVNNLNPEAWISYSRRRENYSDPTRYRAVALTFDRVPIAIDDLAQAGWVESCKTPPGSRGWQSVFRLSHTALDKFSIGGLSISHDPRESIVLRDSNKKCIDYPDTDDTLNMRRNLREFNEAFKSVAIELSGRLIQPGEVLQFKHAVAGPALNSLYRVFNLGRFDLGGRFYGGWWQSIPKERRGDITIDGRLTSEADYVAIHPTLLYGERGMRLHDDPYSASSAWAWDSSWDRDTAKTAFAILLNAGTPKKAVVATAYMLDEQDGGDNTQRRVVRWTSGRRYSKQPTERNMTRAKVLLADLAAQHDAITDRFSKADGRRLQFVDSRMAERVLTEMILKHGIACLPVHDSFVVDSTKLSLLREAMEKSLAIALNELTGGLSWIGFTKTIPQYGESATGTSGLLFFPSTAQTRLPTPSNENVKSVRAA